MSISDHLLKNGGFFFIPPLPNLWFSPFQLEHVFQTPLPCARMYACMHATTTATASLPGLAKAPSPSWRRPWGPSQRGEANGSRRRWFSGPRARAAHFAAGAPLPLYYPSLGPLGSCEKPRAALGWKKNQGLEVEGGEECGHPGGQAGGRRR